MSETTLMDDNLKNDREVKKPYVREGLFLGLILLLFFTVKSSCYEPFRIPSGSMIPTLMVGDFILVDKMSYALKVPFTGGNLFGYNFDPVYIAKWEEPSRGDVIVFKYPKNPSINYIKRVVGIPGDTIEIKNKMLYVNDEPVITEEIDGSSILGKLSGKYRDFNLKFYNAKMNKVTHLVQYDLDNFYRADMEKKKVPKNNYFVLGDNRDFSNDSRFWGMVPRSHIKGKASWIWFSMVLPEDGRNDEEHFEVRYGRIGSTIL